MDELSKLLELSGRGGEADVEEAVCEETIGNEMF